MGEKKRGHEEESSKKSKRRKVDLSGIVESLRSGEYASEDSLEAFKKFLDDSKDHKDDVESSIRNSFDNSLLVKLLTSYTALRTEKDLLVFEVMEQLEKTYSVSFKALQPLVFGDKSAEHYKKLTSLGSTLHRISPNQVLSYLDPSMIWRTVRYYSTGESNVYDVRFLLRLFNSFIQPGADLNCRKFVETNCLALLFSCTSSKDKTIRTLAYYLLQKFLSLLNELQEEKFAERSLVIYLIRLFKQSIETETPRLSNIVSHFFARTVNLMLHPESPIYSPVMSFLCLKPQVDLNTVPELYKLLLSCSVENFKAEREWILVLVNEAMLDPMDYNILQNRSGMKLFMSLFSSSLLDQPARKMILGIIKAAVSMPSVAHDLFVRCNLHTWIAAVITAPKLTRWEQNYLSQIFAILIANERRFSRKKGQDWMVTRAVAGIAAKKVITSLEKLAVTEEISKHHLQAIQDTLSDKWRLKKKKEKVAV